LCLTTFNNMNQNQLSISYLIKHQVKQNLVQSKRIFIHTYNITNVITFVANMYTIRGLFTFHYLQPSHIYYANTYSPSTFSLLLSLINTSYAIKESNYWHSSISNYKFSDFLFFSVHLVLQFCAKHYQTVCPH
jgi:hypothetical protein